MAQLVLKLTVPGVPDIYQGGELWDFSLVDPDNRRPVDWRGAAALLDEIADASASAISRRTGRTGARSCSSPRRLLELRRDHPELFAEGDYQPLDIGEGLDLEPALRFCPTPPRRGAGRCRAAPDLRLYRDGGPADFGATRSPCRPRVFGANIFTGATFHRPRARIRGSELFAEFPVAVLFG